eukprot:768235-Hanusia_phi.AAC.2
MPVGYCGKEVGGALPYEGCMADGESETTGSILHVSLTLLPQCFLGNFLTSRTCCASTGFSRLLQFSRLNLA